MYEVGMVCDGDVQSVWVESLWEAFNAYYFYVEVCINFADCWEVELIDLKEHRVINSCDSEFMGPYYD